MIVGKLMVVLGLDSTGFNTGLNTASGKTTLFAKASDKTFKAISKAAKIGMLAVSAAFIKGAIDAAKFEKALANVSTMLDKTTMPIMKDFKKGILDMSEAYGESTDALAKGLYDILSASIPASKALDVLEVSAKAAKAGLTDTGVAADAITTLMNSFQDATKDASFYSDILFATVKFGKTTFEELAPVVGNVAKLMQVAGGTAEEMAGMLAIMTRNGINTRVAVTGLKGVVSALIKPSEALTEELDGMTVKADGFRAVMDKIGSLPATDLAEMFPNVRALTGVVVAAKGLGEEVDKIQALMAEGSPTMVAFDKNMSTFAATWDRFKATLKVTSITIGNELLPILKEMFEGMITWLKDNREELADFAKNTVEAIQNIVTTIFKMKEALLGLGIAIIGVMAVQKATTAMAAFGIATSVSLGPVVAIAVAIGLMVAAFFKLRSVLRENKKEQELLTAAEKGSLTTIEDYNDAVTIQEAKLNKIRELRQAAIDQYTVEGRLSAEWSAFIEKKYGKRISLANTLYNTIVDNAAKQAEIDAAELAAINDKATAKQLALLESVAAQQEEQRLQDETNAKIRQREALEKLVRDAIFETSATSEQRYAKEKARLLETKLSYDEILEYLKIKFPEAVEVTTNAMDDFWEHEKNAIIVFDYVAKTSAEKFGEKWKKTLEEVQYVYTTLYSSLTGTASAYFSMQSSKLDAEEAQGKDVAKKRAELARKEFYYNKAMSLSQIIINTAVAVVKLLSMGRIGLAAGVGALGAVQAGFVLAEEAPAVPSFIRGGSVDKLIASGAVRGAPAIDTNNVALTNREYVMPPQQALDNIDELEAMRSGGSGGRNITIMPAQVDLIMDDRSVGTAVIEFITEESDRGGFRMNPKVLGALA